MGDNPGSESSEGAAWDLPGYNSSEDCWGRIKSIVYQNCKGSITFKIVNQDFPGRVADKNLPADSRDTGLIPGPGRFPMLEGD